MGTQMALLALMLTCCRLAGTPTRSSSYSCRWEEAPMVWAPLYPVLLPGRCNARRLCYAPAVV